MLRRFAPRHLPLKVKVFGDGISPADHYFHQIIPDCENSMFEKIIDSHSMGDMIAEPVAPMFPPATDRGAWEGLPSHKREALRRLAAHWRGVEYPTLLASQSSG